MLVTVTAKIFVHKSLVVNGEVTAWSSGQLLKLHSLGTRFEFGYLMFSLVYQVECHFFLP